jgi:thioesterase domain-containing protein
MVHLIERDLARHLGRRLPIYGLSYGLAAVSGKGGMRLATDTETTAAHYIGEMRSVQPRGPYRLIGHSLGGQIAYEMAQQLARAGETVEFLGLIDTDAPGDQEKPRLLPLGQVCRNVLQTPPSRLLKFANDRLNETRLVRRAKIHLFPAQSSYRFRLQDLAATRYQPVHYDGRIDFFTATLTRPYIRREPPPPSVGEWRRLSHVVVHPIPGGHLDIVKDPLAAITASTIERAMDKAFWASSASN